MSSSRSGLSSSAGPSASMFDSLNGSNKKGKKQSKDVRPAETEQDRVQHDLVVLKSELMGVKRDIKDLHELCSEMYAVIKTLSQAMPGSGTNLGGNTFRRGLGSSRPGLFPS